MRNPLHPPINERSLPKSVKNARRRSRCQARASKQYEEAVRAQSEVYRDGIERFAVVWEKGLDTVDLDLMADSRWAALWKLSARSLSLTLNLLTQSEQGFTVDDALDRVPVDGIGPIDLDPEYGVEAGDPITVIFGAGSQLVGSPATVEMLDGATDGVLASRQITLAAINRVTFTAPTTEGDVYFRVSVGGTSSATSRSSAAAAGSRRVNVSKSSLAFGPAWYVTGPSLKAACKSGASAAELTTKDDSLIVIQFGGQVDVSSSSRSTVILNNGHPMDQQRSVDIAEEFARCYLQDTSAKTATMILTVNNDRLMNNPQGDRKPLSAEAEAIDRTQGRDWAGGVKQVLGCLQGLPGTNCWNTGNGSKTDRLKVAGGNDIEIPYSSSAAMSAWYDGYLSNRTSGNNSMVNHVDIGDASGCSSAASNGNVCKAAKAPGEPFARSWGIATRAKVAGSGDPEPRSYAAPQIYNRAQPANWKKVSEAATGRALTFSGVTAGGDSMVANGGLSYLSAWQALSRVIANPQRHAIGFNKRSHQAWGT